MDKAFELKPNTLGKIPLTLIDPDPDQPRKDFDENYIAELAASIKCDGVIQPIVVRNNPEQAGRFFIVAGENRWRASKQAKTKTIPAVLREVDGLTKLIIQLKENCQRKDLNPMEWALALRTMNKQHGLKQADIEKTLKESGVGNLGRSYISNTIRLLELPEWAQERIRSGQMTAAHGKYLLPAMASDKVLEVIQIKMGNGWEPTTRELQQAIYWGFAQHHKDLTNWHTQFDFLEKCVASGCQKMRKVTGNNTESTFCLDQACHAKHQAEAAQDERAEREARNAEQEASEPAEIISDSENRVDVNQLELRLYQDYIDLEGTAFDATECITCPHNHIATNGDHQTDACFNMSCFEKKRESHHRAETLVYRHMRKTISQYLDLHPAIAVRILAWMSIGSPDGLHQDEDSEYIIEGFIPLCIDEDGPQKTLFKYGLFSLRRFIDADDNSLTELAKLTVSEMHGNNVIELWRLFGMSIGDYLIDETYLAEHTEPELNTMLERVTWAPCDYAEMINAQNAGRLDQFMLTYAKAFGVPIEISYAYKQMMKGDDDA